MFIYGKMASAAIAVMSYLAEDANRRADSKEIAIARRLPRYLTAKILTKLSGADLIRGHRGPGGGYKLAKPASNICLMDIVRVFDHAATPVLCPLGPHQPIHDDCCPLHDSIAKMITMHRRFMIETSLAIFEKHTKKTSK